MNRKKLERLCIGLTSFAVISAFAVTMLSINTINAIAATGDAKSQIHELESKLSGLKNDASSIKKQVASAKNNAADAASQIASLDAETTNLSSQINTMETLISQWQTLSDQKTAEIADLEVKQEKEQETFDNMLRMSYEYGSDTYFNLIFGSENIGDFLSRADLITYHLKYNNNVLENLATTKQNLQKTRDEYEQSTNELTEYKASQEQLKASLEAKLKQAQQQKAQYESDAASAQAMYEKKLAETNRINAEIKELYEQQKKSDTTTYTGTFGYPLPSGYKTVSSGFVNRISPITGKAENHNGLDLPAPYGTSIYAADAGTVTTARTSSSWGNYIIINHGGGVMTLYAHCSSLNVSAGQTVKRGDTIGYVGSTGWSTGNHLHFTVYKNGTAVNPASYIGL